MDPSALGESSYGLLLPGPSSQASSSTTPSPPSEQPVKKKRKQNQACDACKARRVKCDLGDLPPGSSSCSKCAAKGIACTAILNAIREPPKRVGVRIEAAKRTFGSVDGPGGGEPTSSSTTRLVRFHQPGPSSVYGTAPGRQLAHAALSQALERDLLMAYFDHAHFTVQAIDPFEFKKTYNAAGQLSQYMSPADQVRCAVMCAWGARYSFNPEVVPRPYANPPSAETGLVREPACEALLSRAQSMMDSYGLLRKPSTETVQTLMLMSPLLEYQYDASNKRNGTVDSSEGPESELLEGIMAQHVESLGLWDASPVVGYEKGIDGEELIENTELTGLKIMMQMRNQRLLWSAWIWDSFRSAAGRKAPRFSDEVLFDICPHIPRLGDPLPVVPALSDAQCFLLLVSAYPMLAERLRYLAKNVTIPSVRKRNMQKIDELAKHAHVFWKAMDDFSVWFDEIAERLLGIFPTLTTFSPIAWYIAINLGHTLTTLFCHRTLYERNEAEIGKARATMPAAFFESASSTGSSPKSDGQPSIASPQDKIEAEHEKMGELYLESQEITLAEARRSARLVSKVLDTEFMQSGGNELKELRIIASFLAEQPVVEEGYEGKRRSSWDWTWSNKVQEVSWLLDGMRQVGHGWGSSTAAIPDVVAAMIRRTPKGLPTFAPVSRQPRPQSPNLGTDLTNVRYGSMTSINELRTVLDHTTLPSGSDSVDSPSSDDRWSTLSSDARSAGSRKGGLEIPARDLHIAPAFTLDQGHGVEDRNPFTGEDHRASMTDDSSASLLDMIESFPSITAAASLDEQNVLFDDDFLAGPSFEELLAPQSTETLSHQHQQQRYQSAFHSSVAAQSIQQDFGTTEMQKVFRSLEGDGLGDMVGGFGGAAGLHESGTGGDGLYDLDNQQRAFEMFLASFPTATPGASDSGWSAQ